MSMLSLNSFLILILLCIHTITPKDESRPTGVVQSGDLVCTGEINANSLTVALNHDFYSTDAEMSKIVANEVIVARLNTIALMTSILVSNNKMNTIFINSFLKVNGQIKYDSSREDSAIGTSFIQLGHKNLYINNVKQWKLVREIEMEDVNREMNVFINGVLAKEKEKDSNKVLNFDYEVTKSFNVTANPFEHLLIEGSFKFLNHIWNNNTAYVKVNDNLYWLDHHNWEGESLACDEEKWNSPIRIIVPFKNSGIKNHFVKVTIGIKLHYGFNYGDLKINECPLLLSLLDKAIEFDSFHISLK